MLDINEEYLMDEKGNKRAIVVPISEWHRILEALEELDDIKTYDEAKSQPSEPVPFEQAVEEIKRGNMS